MAVEGGSGGVEDMSRLGLVGGDGDVGDIEDIIAEVACK